MEQQAYKIQVYDADKERWFDHAAGQEFTSSYAAKQVAKRRGLEFGSYRIAKVEVEVA